MVQRVEIITGREARRRWTVDEKQGLLAEAFAPGAVVEHVARRHGVATSCLYNWRHRFGAASVAAASCSVSKDVPRMIPLMITPDVATIPASDTSPPAPILARAVVTLPDGTRLEIDAGYPPRTVKALIEALSRR
jgi:transposase